MSGYRGDMLLLHFVPAETRDRGDDASRPRGPTPTPSDASTFGVYLFLITLCMLFGASLVGYVITRLNQLGEPWQGYRVPGLLPGLAISTVLVIGVSAALHFALKAVRHDRAASATKLLLVADLLALGFLANQIHNWSELIRFHGGLMQNRDLSLFLFYALTALHALHVIGGYVPLAIATVRTSRGRYTAASHRGLLNCAIYWHFLDVVWVVLAIALLLG